MDVTYHAKYYRWQCRGCKKQVTAKSGTLFEDSPLKLETLLTGAWLITNAKNGISSCEVARALGVTQKTAWFLLHRVRHAWQTGTIEKMAGTVHLALGRSYPETGGANASALHWDLICDLREGGRLTADGEPITV